MPINKTQRMVLVAYRDAQVAQTNDELADRMRVRGPMRKRRVAAAVNGLRRRGLVGDASVDHTYALTANGLRAANTIAGDTKV